MERSLSYVIRELLQSMAQLIQCEMRLARVEMTQNAKGMFKGMGSSAVFGVIAWMGTWALLAAAVIGLGKILGENYWLSALIWGVLLVGIGGAGVLRGMKQVSGNASLETTKNSIRYDKNLVTRKLHDVSDRARKEAA